MTLLELKNILDNVKKAKSKSLKDLIREEKESSHELLHKLITSPFNNIHHPSHFINEIDNLSDEEVKILEKKLKEDKYLSRHEEFLKKDFLFNSHSDNEYYARSLNEYLILKKKINERLGRNPYHDIDKKLFNKTFLEAYHPHHLIDLDDYDKNYLKKGELPIHKKDHFKSFSKAINYIDDIDTLKELKNKYENYINYFKKHREDHKENIPYIEKFYKEKIEPLIDSRINEIQKKKTF